MKVLVIDDDLTLLKAISLTLETDGFEVIKTESLSEAREKLSQIDFDLVVSDHNLPDGLGFDLIKELKEEYPSTDIILVTGQGDIDLAVKSMRFGAYDFITKPIDTDIFLERVNNWKEEFLLTPKARDTNNYGSFFDGVIGENPQMRQALRIITRVAPTDAVVLILGETGTGKELIAKGLHKASNRRDAPFVSVNCAAIPDTLIESELFGFEKGAFSGAYSKKKGKFELAQNGTIFLDEIGDLSANTQAKLLRILQDKLLEPLGSEKQIELDVRIIAATHQPLEQMVSENKFRQDLYYRLNIVTINLPPLRDRIPDIDEFVTYFINEFNNKFSRSIKSVSNDALNVLKNYNWPGNIRELMNIMERACILAENEIIGINDIKLPQDAMNNSEKKELKDEIESIEKRRIVEALEKSDGNQKVAAELMGINRTTLRYKMKKYNLI